MGSYSDRDNHVSLEYMANGQDSRDMPSATVSNGLSIPASMLMDRKSVKKHIPNGISFESTSSPFAFCSFTLNHINKPHASSPFRSQSASPKPENDAYFKIQGRSNLSKPSMHISNTTLSPRQLLDPKAFCPTSLVGSKDVDPGLPIKSKHVNGDRQMHDSTKRDGRNPMSDGMGAMIERFHGISERSEYPQKKQKIEKSDAEDEKAVFAGGSKGGEIAEYLKHKREEGRESLKPESNVVDLTEG